MRLYVNKIENRKNCIYNKDRILSGTFNAWTDETIWKY